MPQGGAVSGGGVVSHVGNPALHCHVSLSRDDRGCSAFTLSQRILVFQRAGRQ